MNAEQFMESWMNCTGSAARDQFRADLGRLLSNERERCARIAERWAAHGDPTGQKIADEIRAEGYRPRATGPYDL